MVPCIEILFLCGDGGVQRGGDPQPGEIRHQEQAGQRVCAVEEDSCRERGDVQKPENAEGFMRVFGPEEDGGPCEVEKELEAKEPRS